MERASTVPSGGERVDFVIVTALEEERDAVLKNLADVKKLDKDGLDTHTYYAAKVSTTRSDGVCYNVIVTSLASMGPIMAVAKAGAIVSRWHPKHVLLVGIACGIRGEAAYGDVLVAHQVADYTLGKIPSSGQREIRWNAFPAGASLLDSALNMSKDWLELVTVSRPSEGSPTVRSGVIASGPDVVSNDDVVANYRGTWGKLVGIEMEGGGTATGLHNTASPPEFLMLKAVSDFGSDKHDDAVKPWRPYACDAAAAFAFGLIRSGPSPARG